MLFQGKRERGELEKLRRENETLKKELEQYQSWQQKQWENFWMYDGYPQEGAENDK